MTKSDTLSQADASYRFWPKKRCNMTLVILIA